MDSLNFYFVDKSPMSFILCFIILFYDLFLCCGKLTGARSIESLIYYCAQFSQKKNLQS